MDGAMVIEPKASWLPAHGAPDTGQVIFQSPSGDFVG